MELPKAGQMDSLHVLKLLKFNIRGEASLEFRAVSALADLIRQEA